MQPDSSVLKGCVSLCAAAFAENVYVGLIVMMPFLAPLLKHVAKRFPSPSSREVRRLCPAHSLPLRARISPWRLPKLCFGVHGVAHHCCVR